MARAKTVRRLRPFFVLLLTVSLVVVGFGAVQLIGLANASRQYLEQGKSITITQEGTNTIFYEYQLVPTLNKVPKISFVDNRTGEETFSQTASVRSSYSINSLKGISVAVVELPVGEYTVQISPNAGEEGQFVLDSGYFSRLLSGILLTVFGFIGLIAAIVGIAVTAAMQRRDQGQYDPVDADAPWGQ